MAEVRIEHISKVYGEGNKKGAPKTIDDVSFTVRDKEFLVIVGPSGCGKSTLLRMIAGLEEITEGELLIDGVRMNERDPASRDLAMVFQNYALYPHMTVYENMAFGLRIKKMSKSAIRERVMETARLLELEAFLDRKPKLLSGGQRQRVAIGRALVRRPKVFLFDEPLSNLDAKLRSQMRIELQKLHREINATMIYVTHDQVEAMTLGHRIAVLQGGRLMQLDTPLQLYNHPANQFVAGFIGSPAMNFIEGQVANEGTYVFRSATGDCSIRLCDIAFDAKKLPGRQLLLGIRPEHIIVSEAATALAGSPVFAVTAFENMGNEQLVYFDRPGKAIIVRQNPDEQLDYGQQKALHFLPQRIVFIDMASGNVINPDDSD